MEKGAFILVGVLALLVSIFVFFASYSAGSVDPNLRLTYLISSVAGILVAIGSLFSIAGSESHEVFHHTLSVVLFAVNLMVVVLGFFFLYEFFLAV